jgi:tRNA G26 N,N-dimethylase Trm1
VVEHLAVPPSPARPKEIQSWIERFRAEAEVDQPFFYEPNQIARTLHLAQPPPLEALLAGLRASGAKAARAHPQASALRTDAPRSVVESVARSLGTRA